MTFGAIDLLFNLAAMLFWLRAWPTNSRLAMFNPYAAGVENFTQTFLELFKPMARAHGERFAAALCWLTLIIFRGVALPLAAPQNIRENWMLRFGMEIWTPADYPMATIVFSCLSFFILFLQIAILAALYSRVRAPERPAEFFHSLSAPFSWRRFPSLQLAGIIVCGICLVFTLNLAASKGSPTNTEGVVRQLLQGMLNILGEATNLLTVLQALIIISIIGSWVAMFAGGNAMAIITREWLDFWLGPFRRLPLQIGFLDLTPFLAFFILSGIQWFINSFVIHPLYLFLLR